MTPKEMPRVAHHGLGVFVAMGFLGTQLRQGWGGSVSSQSRGGSGCALRLLWGSAVGSPLVLGRQGKGLAGPGGHRARSLGMCQDTRALGEAEPPPGTRHRLPVPGTARRWEQNALQLRG